MKTKPPPVPYLRQTRHKPIQRLLTALYWLDAEAQVLRSKPLEVIRTGRIENEGHSTTWARKAHKRYLYRINQLAEQIENDLDPHNTTTPRESRTRCKGCGRWQQPNWKHCPHCAHTHDH